MKTIITNLAQKRNTHQCTRTWHWVYDRLGAFVSGCV